MQDSIGSATGIDAWHTFGDRAPIGLAVTAGEEHRLEYTNPAFARLSGSPGMDLCGCSMADILRAPDLTQHLDAVLRTGEALHGMTIRDGDGRSYRLSAWPRGEADGRASLIIELEVDERLSDDQQSAELNDEIREVNSRLIRAAIREEELADQARAASRAKSDFLALISHELRTPLTAVIGYTDMLQTGQGGLNERGAVWAERIKFSASHLRQIVDDLISTVAENRAADNVSPESTCADAIAREAVALVESSAAEKGLEVRVRVPRSVIPLHTDRRKVRQVLVNLLSNSVKFTAKGHIDLEVEQNGDSVAFRVTDTGIGIAEADQERIFEPFVQVDPSTTRRFGGCGLGLGLSRRYARALGGDITIESSPGSGSTFTLTLPASSPATRDG